MDTTIGVSKDTRDHTTIILNKDIRDNLKKLGQKGQTYDDLIQELIKEWRKNN